MTCSTFMLILLRRLQFLCKQFRTSGPWLRVTTGSNLKGVRNTNIYTQSLQFVSGIGAASANSIVSRSKKLIVITKTNCTAICMWVSHYSDEQSELHTWYIPFYRLLYLSFPSSLCCLETTYAIIFSQQQITFFFYLT